MPAYVSCAKNGNPEYPAKKVTNAFRSRGAWVYAEDQVRFLLEILKGDAPSDFVSSGS